MFATQKMLENLEVSTEMVEFGRQRDEWTRGLEVWNKRCRLLKKQFNLLNYFTINHIRWLIQKCNQFIETKNNENIKMILLPHFQKINPFLTMNEFELCLNQWKHKNENSDNALKAFHNNFLKLLPNSDYNCINDENNKFIEINEFALKPGEPCLVVTKHEDAFFAVLKVCICVCMCVCVLFVFNSVFLCWFVSVPKKQKQASKTNNFTHLFFFVFKMIDIYVSGKITILRARFNV